MLLLYRLCQLMFAGGLLSLVLATANEILGLGIWQSDGYPSLTHNSNGQELPTTYGTFIWRFALATAIVGLVGVCLHWYLARREAARYLAALEGADESELDAVLAAVEEERLRHEEEARP